MKHFSFPDGKLIFEILAPKTDENLGVLFGMTGQYVSIGCLLQSQQ